MAIIPGLDSLPMESFPTREVLVEIAEFYGLTEDEIEESLEAFWEIRRLRGLQ